MIAQNCKLARFLIEACTQSRSSLFTMVVVLLSPAKTLCWDLVTSSLQCHKPAFLKQSDAVVQSVKGVGPAALKKLLGISDQLATLNAERYQAFKLSDELDFSADADHLRPAGFAYDGPAYLGAEFRSMTPEELDFAQQSVCILSAVYGVLKPLDLIQQYRLEMNTKLAVGDDTAKYAFIYRTRFNAVQAAVMRRHWHTVVTALYNSSGLLQIAKSTILLMDC
jgi:uncharacterized protein